MDSHDYAPDGAPEGQRFSQSQDTWAENLALMFTFRGIPCVYYGSEIEFKKGCVIDKGPNIALKETGRAYYGGYIKGEINVTDFAEYSNASGNIAQTLNHPLALHIQRLAKIRMAVPALRKGQYSTEGCSGSFAFKRRYTDATTDSYALVTISGGATFSGVENGTYVDCVTGDTKTVNNGTLSVSCSGKGNMRVYVLNTEKINAPGKIGVDGKYVYGTKNAGNYPTWDGTQEELDDRFGQGGNTDWGEPVEPCLASATERAVFFKGEKEWGTSVAVYMWNNNGNIAEWPGQRAEHLGGGTFKYLIPENVDVSGSDWQIIWNNNGNGKQTADLKFQMHGEYTKDGYQNLVTTLCDGGDTGETPDNPDNPNIPQPSEMCLKSADERVVFFEKSNDFGGDIHCYMWFTAGSTNEICGKWPGKAAAHLYDNVYRFEIPASAPAINDNWMIIWNDGSGNQTADLKYTNQGLYKGTNKSSISCTSQITKLCETTDVEKIEVVEPVARKVLIKQSLYLVLPNGDMYDVSGRLVR